VSAADPPSEDGSQLTPQLLTEALRSSGHPVVVTGVRAEPVGTGQMGSSFRLHLDIDGDRGGVPPTLVAKVPGGPPERRAAVAGSYRTEVEFYRRLAPTLSVRVPQCWHASISEDATEFLLLLEDLAPAVQGDQIAGCSPDEALGAARNLAGLHAPRWCDPTLGADAGLEPMDDEAAAMLGAVLEPMTATFVDRFAGRLHPADRDVLDAVPEVAGAWLLGRPERFAPVHGDYRLDNLMFTPGGGPVIALDWQTVSLGLPARDLAYLCATGLDPDLRRLHEDRIVGEYHRALTEGVNGGPGVHGYDLDLCREDYRYAMLQAPLIIVLGCAVGTPTERGDSMFLAMTERACAAIRDHDPFSLIPP
jgi:hypothetical protein